MLICFDNADDLLEHAWCELKQFLEKIQSETRLNVQIILTSRPQNCFLYDILSTKREGFFEVEPLKEHESVSLFLNSTQDAVSCEEICTFLEETHDYSFESIGICLDQLHVYEINERKLRNFK